MLDIEQIKKILPQRAPFLMVDRILEVEPGKMILAVKNVSVNDDFFKGHFPGKPIMPGVLIVEALAQASIVLFYATKQQGASSKMLYYLGSVKMKFLKPVVPGDQLKLKVEPLKMLSQAAIVKAAAYVGEDKIAEGELAFSSKKADE